MPSEQLPIELLLEKIKTGSIAEKLFIFKFNKSNTNKEVLAKFKLFANSQYLRYFKGTPAPFHDEMVMNMIRSYRGEKYINLAFRGSAKRQPLTANILTPSGFRKMGELKLGDYVIGSDGKKTQIEFMSEIVDRPIYEVRTEDGRKTECDSEHLWTVRKMTNVRNKHVTIDTQKMLDDGLFYDRVDKRCGKKFKEYKFALDTVQPVDLKKRKLEIDPYILGIILGDGSLDKTTGFTRLHFHKDDDSHYRNNLKVFNVSDTKYDKRNTNVGRFSIRELGPRIKKLGLNVNCYAKFIPEDYLFSSIEDRKAVLEGLMDTDGTVNSGTPSFSTVSEKLADGVMSLVRSLGGRASKKKNIYNGNTSFRVSILFTDYKPFRLERKLKICKLAKHTFSRIISIKRIENKLGRCIKVSNEDGLYVTDDFILTHNTTLMKLFVVFVLLNDEDHANRYLKILSRDIKNPRQIVTDVYNLCLEVKNIYGDVFEKEGDKKREETMQSFTMKSGVKFSAGTVGQSQRGHAQDAYRPDWIWFDDIEDRESVSSQVITEGIISRVDEAITGLAKGGSYVVTGNYISEYGVIQWFLNKESVIKQIVPIMVNGKPTWNIYTVAEIEQLKKDSEDFYGEYMCDPARSEGKFFDLDMIEEDMKYCEEPIKVVGGVKYWNGYAPQARYGLGADTSEGIGRDSNAMAVFNYRTGDLEATYHSNEIKPELFAYEIARVAREFGECVAGPEINNMSGGIVITTLKNIYPDKKIFRHKDRSKVKDIESAKYGWHTNRLTKPDAFLNFRKDYNDGLIHIFDIQVLKEMKSFTNLDLEEHPESKITRHFDLLMAVVIAWAVKDFYEASDIATVSYPQLD